MKFLKGFTLIEMMVVVLVIGILAAIALPVYSDYVLRGQLTEAFSKLSAMQLSMEQYYQDNRSYSDNNGACGVSIPTGTNFTFTCTAATSQSYIATATGVAGLPTAAFIYTIDQSTAKATTGAAAGWTAATMPATCWIRGKGGIC